MGVKIPQVYECDFDDCAASGNGAKVSGEGENLPAGWVRRGRFVFCGDHAVTGREAMMAGTLAKMAPVQQAPVVEPEPSPHLPETPVVGVVRRVRGVVVEGADVLAANEANIAAHKAKSISVGRVIEDVQPGLGEESKVDEGVDQ